MGLPKIGAVLALDGEREYKSAITSINSAQRSLRAEMRLVSEEFYGQENSLEALTERHRILEQQQAAQTVKVNVAEQAWKKYAEAQEYAGKRIEEAVREVKTAEEQLEKLKKTSGVTTEEIEKQEKALEKAKTQLETASREYENISKKETEWKITLTNAEAELKKTNRELEENKGYLEEAWEATDSHAKSVDAFGKKIKEAGEESEEFRKKTVDAVTALSAVLSTGTILEGIKDIAGVLLECADASASFETAMAKVGTIADANVVPLENMSKDILSISSEIGVASKDIAEATYNAISAGQNTADAVEFAGRATKLAIGGFTDAATAVDILTTALNAYGLESEKTEEISDMLVTTQNLGKTTVAELADAMGRVIPLASAYNVKMDNLSAAYALMTANGIATAETTTYLKAMFTELGDSNSAVAKVLQEQTGKTFVQLSEEGSSLGEVMEILGQSVEGDAAKFSELWGSSEAGIGALSLLNSGTEKYNKTLEAMRKSTGATETAFKEMSDTTEMAESRMNTSMENLKIAVGDVLKPSLEEVYESGTNLLNWAEDFVNAHPEVVEALTALAIGAGTFTAALTVATAAMKAFEMIKTLVNPTTLLVTALAGVASAAISFAAAMDVEETGLRKVNSETQEAIKVSKELNKVQKEAAAERASSRKELETEAEVCRSLVKELEGLQGKTNLTAAEQSRMQMIVSQLNQALPDLNLAIDEQTGKLNTSTEALWGNVEAMNQLAIAEAARADLEEIAAAQYENEKQLSDLREQQAEQLIALREAQTVYNEALERSKETGEALWAQNAEMDLQQVQENYDALLEEINATKDAQQGLAEEWIETNEYISDTTALYTAGEAVGETGAAYEAAGEHVAAAAGAIQKSFSEMGASIRESVEEQMDIFSEYEKQTAESSEEILSNMQSQIEGFRDWGDNLAELATRSDENGALMSQGLLQHLVDLGPEGAGYVEAFVNMTDEQLREANELWGDAIALPDEIAKKFEESGASLIEGLNRGIESKTPKAENSMATTAKKSLTEFNKEAGIQSPSKKMEQSGKDLVAGLVSGIKKDTPTATGITRTLATEVVAEARRGMSPEIGHTIGLQFASGLSGGIRAGRSAVINAAVDVARAAVAAARNELGIHSPSKVTEEMGGYFMDGWVLGIQAKTENLKDAVRGALDTALVTEAKHGSQKAIADLSGGSEGGSKPGADLVQIYVQPLQMSEEELDKTFDYINERFGYAL